MGCRRLTYHHSNSPDLDEMKSWLLMCTDGTKFGALKREEEDRLLYQWDQSLGKMVPTEHLVQQVEIHLGTGGIFTCAVGWG